MKMKALIIAFAVAFLIAPCAVNATTISISGPALVDPSIFEFDVFVDDIGTLANLDYWNLRLGITPMDNATFVGAADVRTDPSYVFFGDADDYLVSLVPPYTITIANNTASGAGAAVAGGELLATVSIDATAALPGSIYDINIMDLGTWTFFGDNDIGFDADVVLAAPYQFEVVPIPAAVWLLGSGLLALVGLRRKLS